MKTDIWVECYIKITNFLRNCKRIFLSKYLYSVTWRSLARFDIENSLISVETLTFGERRFFQRVSVVWKCHDFFVSLR